MTYSKLVKYVKPSPHNSGRRKHKIDTITIHCVAGTLNIYQLGEWFASKSSKCSSNYGIDNDGNIACYVDEDNRSWCSSNSENDNRAITIEVSNTIAKEPYPISDIAYEALIQLCCDICLRYGIEKLVWSDSKDDRVNHKNGCNMTVHRDYAKKSCPGQYIYERLGQIADDVNQRLYNASPLASEPISPVTNTVLAHYKSSAYRRSWTVSARAGVNVRCGAGTNYNIIDKIEFGSIVQCYGYYDKDKNKDKWLLIQHKGKTGYIHSNYLK